MAGGEGGGGKPHPMNSHGIPKGLLTILEEWGVNTCDMLQDEMKSVLGSHPDFRADEKSRLEHFLLE